MTTIPPDMSEPDRRASGAERSPDAARRVPWLMVWVACAAGAGLRLAQLAANRPLWIDEAAIALNVVGRPFGGGRTPLDYAQSATPGFIVLARAVVAVIGPSAAAFRVVPFVCALLVPPAVWLAARRFMDRPAAAFATAVAALSPLLLRYATEVKAYALDALVATVLVGLAAWVLDAPDDRRRWRWLQGVGASAIWLSLPSVFVLAGAGLALLAAAVQPRRAAAIRARVAVTAAVWGASAGAAYWWFIRASAGNSFLRWYFEAAFLAPDAPDLRRRVVNGAFGFVLTVLYDRTQFAPGAPALRIATAVLAVALGAAGVVAVARRRGAPGAALLVVPILAAALASSARVYPFAPRVLSFGAPLLAMLVAAGAGAATARLRRGRWWVAGALLLAPAAVHDVVELRRPTTPQGVPGAELAGAVRGVPADEPVYLSPFAIPGWVYYTTNWARPDAERLRFFAHVARGPDGPSLQVHPSRRGAVLPDEATGLARANGRRPELAGLFSGVDYRDVVPAPRPGDGRWGAAPDSGWLEGEVARMRAAANPCVVVLGLGPRSLEARLIAARARQVGGRVDAHAPLGRTGVLGRMRLCFAG